MGKLLSSPSKKKKKRSRDSSRKKKRRGTESKKILQRNDDSDESESSSKECSSFSSSEDDYRRGKRRSKGSKKRSRRRDSSNESDDDKKKKKKNMSKRKYENGGKKRIRLRKRRGRDMNVSSATSESECSDSGESEDGRTRRRSKLKSKDRRRLIKIKAKRSRSNDGSNSDSLCSHDVESECSDSGESEDGRKRGRSKLKGKDKRRLIKIKAKRSRSNDGSKSDSLCSHDVETDEFDKVKSEKSYKRLRSVIVVPTTSNDDERKHEIRYDKGELEALISTPRIGVDEDMKMEASQANDLNDNSKGDDLETILRLRALENLRRFRGVTKRNEIASKETSSAKGEESLGHDRDRVEQNPGVSAGSKVFESSHETDYQKESESESVLHDLTSKRREISNLSSGQQAAVTQEAQAEVTIGCNINKDYTETSHLAPKEGTEKIEPKDNNTPYEQSSSCAEPEVDGNGSDKPRDETKDGFQEKTMTVMRGGELVQATYKVYIPKKTPALARRKIKR